MKNWFFHQERGQTLGPINLDEMKTRIRTGRIRLFDLVYREGEPGWRMALEHPDLRSEFKSTSVQTMVDRPWVCLQRKSEGGFDFGTSGPFTTDDIRLALQEGRIAYSDYVWKDGYREWKRIGTVEAFNRRLSERKESAAAAAPPLPEIPGKELLKNVVELKRPQASAPLPPPPEAVGGDLIQEPLATGQTAPVASSAKPAAGAPMETPPSLARASRRRRTSAWVDWGVVALLAIVLCAVVMMLARYMNRENAAEPPIVEPPPLATIPEPVQVPEPTPDPIQLAKPPPEPVAEVKPEPVKPAAKAPERPVPVKNVAPTELYLAVQNVGKNQLKIDLRTDASGDEYPVYVQIIGLPGQVSDGASFYKFIKLNPKGNRKESLGLSGLKLPQGRFIIRADTGDLKKEVRMSAGVNEPQFKLTVARLRKLHAHAFWKERLELFRLSQILDKQLTESLAGKKFSAKGLDALAAVKRSNCGNYVLCDQWFELKEILAAASKGSSMTLLGRLKQAREKLSTFSVWK